jgi:predicted RND superfamily exporter protein
MRTFAEFITRKSVAFAVILCVLALSLFGAINANRVQEDDDILAFLPKTNRDVASFYDVAGRFGSLDVALVGIEAEDALSPEFLGRLKALTKQLNETEGVENALSLTSVEDFVADRERGGITADYLVREIPSSPEQAAALREKVLSRDHIVGNLVSSDGRAVMIYVFAAQGTEPRTTAHRVRAAVEKHFPSETKYWHGAPFVSTYIYELTQEDLRRLAPWACAAISLVVLLSFRDLVGTLLALLSTVLGIVLPLGIMGFFGIHSNIVLGSMPVILFGLGSAYGVHLLTRFYALAAERPRHEALVEALVDVGPSIIGSGLTTSVGLLSFVMMDIPPMRTFGIFTAIGLTLSLILAIVFIPAVLVVLPLTGKSSAPFPWLGRMMATVSVGARHHKPLGFAVTLALVALSAVYASRVSSTLDTTAFFDEDSPPAQADAFMQRHFGGSQFIQIEVRGDMNDPAVLREVQLLSDRIALIPDVSSVTHIGAIVATINEAMDDVRRIPDAEDKVRTLFSFLAGKRAVSQTVTDDRDVALITIKVAKSRAEEVERVLADIVALTKQVPASITRVAIDGSQGPNQEAAQAHRAEIVAARIVALARQLGAPVESPEQLHRALLSDRGQAQAAAVEAEIVAFMKTEAFDSPIPKGDVALAAAIAKGVAALGAPPFEDSARKVWRAKVPGVVAAALNKDASDPMVDDTALSLEQNVGEIWVRERARADSKLVVSAAGLVIPEGPRGERLRTFIGHALLDLDLGFSAVPGEGKPMSLVVTGLPVLYRGLSDSVFNNQWNSLWFALVLVVGLKALLFRSLTTGLLSSIPTLVTLTVVYGGMGVLGVRLDIGTSMLASLIIGAGDDYAVQFLWSWFAPKGGSLDDAARVAAIENGAGIWTNALMVAIGFFVLTLGDARPLQNVGGLTAAAMLAAAVATFLITPLLARRRYYAPTHSDS